MKTLMHPVPALTKFFFYSVFMFWVMLFLPATSDACATPPTANFTASPTTFCQGGTVAFTDQSTESPTSWSWTFPGGTPGTSTVQNPTVVYNSIGVYDVTLAATNTYGTGTLTKYGYIHSGAAPVATFTASPTTVCQGSSVTFTDQTTNSPTSWSWTFPGGTPGSSTSQNPTVIYNTNGTHNVTLTATNPYCSGTLTKTGYINVAAGPVAIFAASPTTVCQGGAVTFADQSANAPTSWSWTFPGGTPGTSAAQNPTVIYNSNGVYDVTLAASNSNCTGTLTKTGYINVNAPSAAFTVSPTTFCQGDPVLFTAQSDSCTTSWSWTFAGGSPGTSASQNQTVVYNTAGSYTVSLIASNATGSDTAVQIITVQTCLGIPSYDWENDITVFPNLSSGHYSVTSGSEITRIEVFTLMGEKVFGLSGVNSTIASINISEFADGIYTATITCGDKSVNKKIIKQ